MYISLSETYLPFAETRPPAPLVSRFAILKHLLITPKLEYINVDESRLVFTSPTTEQENTNP